MRVEPQKHYNPIENSISLDVAIVQAATMLDEVGMEAIKQGDTETMLAVAAGWMEFGSKMLGSDHEDREDGEEEEVLSETSVLGFQSPENREVLENEKTDSKRKFGL